MMNSDLVRELIDDLEREINNGGFDQFFFNSAGDRTREIIDALTSIGAIHTAAIVERAAAKFPEGFPQAPRNERQFALEEISPDGDAFEVENREFLDYGDDLATLANAYV